MSEETPTQPTEALVKQDALPTLDVVRNKDGSDRLVARQKGKFTKIANARVLATQQSVNRILHTPNAEGRSQLERVIESQMQVAEANTDARNLGGVTKLLEVTDELSGTKAAREALTREVNERVIPRVVIVAPVLMNPGVIDYNEQQRKAADKKGPSQQFLDAEVVEQNPAKGEDRC